MERVDKSELFRLAAVLYADNNYEVKPKTIHKKIVESALLDNGNRDMSVDELVQTIDDRYDFVFTSEEVVDIINSDDKSFLVTGSNGNRRIQLTSKRMDVLREKLQKNTIDYFIQQFIEQHESFGAFDVKVIIYKFLFEVFTVNINSFTKLLDYKKDIGEIKNLEVGKFSDAEKGIINKFLQWDNDAKNKSIFDIASYALEYCLITNSSKKHEIHLDNLRNKTFYLDTNIIFRALGINGDNRKARTTTFLKKFNEAKEALVISKFTEAEFKATVKFYVAKIDKTINPRINSSFFRQYNQTSEFFDYFHAWRAKRHNDSLDLFEAHLFTLYETFKKEFSITVDFAIPFDEGDDKVKAEIDAVASDIYSFKHLEGKDKQIDYEVAKWDARNLHLIAKRRGAHTRNIFEAQYFFISSDQSLRRWDYQRNPETPTVLLPSQWLSILLRYLNRTNDDFRSFVSFLNLSQNEAHLSGEKFQLVLAGIAEITSDVEQQKTIIEVMIEKKFQGIVVNGFSDEEIIGKSREQAKTLLEEALKDSHLMNRGLQEELHSHLENSGVTIQQLREEKAAEEEKVQATALEVQEKERVIKIKGDEAEALRQVLRGKFVTGKLRKWKAGGVLGIIGALLITASYCLIFCFRTEWWNYACAICKWVNTYSDGSVEKSLLSTALWAPSASLIWFGKLIYHRFLNAESRVQKLKKIEEELPEQYKSPA
ncbi:MAG: hypothetical protein EOO06_12780 [Chitinophagaceae bacterium]|nr:MAG: hypothetical protein EOO06_12780 [Chitinophagaceae bacterium]